MNEYYVVQLKEKNGYESITGKIYEDKYQAIAEASITLSKFFLSGCTEEEFYEMFGENIDDWEDYIDREYGYFVDTIYVYGYQYNEGGYIARLDEVVSLELS